MTLILVFSFTIIIEVEKITQEEENYSNYEHKDRHLWITLEKIIIIRKTTSDKSKNTPQLSTDKSFSAGTLHVHTHRHRHTHTHYTQIHIFMNAYIIILLMYTMYRMTCSLFTLEFPSQSVGIKIEN